MSDINDAINVFGEIIDKVIKEEHIILRADFPAGSVEPQIRSSFDNLKELKSEMDLYLSLYIVKTTIKSLIESETVDPEKVSFLIDGIIDMVKDDLKSELVKEAADGEEK